MSDGHLGDKCLNRAHRKPPVGGFLVSIATRLHRYLRLVPRGDSPGIGYALVRLKFADVAFDVTRKVTRTRSMLRKVDLTSDGSPFLFSTAQNQSHGYGAACLTRRVTKSSECTTMLAVPMVNVPPWANPWASLLRRFNARASV